MTNQTSQPEYSTVNPSANGSTVQGQVLMTLDSNTNPQAASNNNPVPIIDAYLAPVVTSWNSSTALNAAVTMNTAGMDNVAVTVIPTGTLTAGAVTFEVYDGANWVALKCARESSYNTDSTYNATAATAIQGWTAPCAGYPEFRVRLSTQITGSSSPGLTVTTIVSSTPDVSVVTAGLDPLQAGHPGIVTLQAEQVVAVGASSASSAAVQSTTNRVFLVSTTGCWVSFGSAPTAVAAATGNIYVPPNVIMPPVAVTPGVTKIAAIEASAAGSLSIIESL